MGDVNHRAAAAAALVLPDEGRINRRIFTDPDVYELEQERIFGRCWLYVGHESEVRDPGDFAASSMGEDPVLLIRDRPAPCEYSSTSAPTKAARSVTTIAATR